MSLADPERHDIFAGKLNTMKNRDCYLVSTDHLEDQIWFRDDADFKVGMNYVALIAAMMGIRILAFVLMSNHVHFVLEGTREEALAFITEFKRRYSKYVQRKYGIRKLLRSNGVDIRPVGLEEESLERAIAYVQMNCVAANICVHPLQYPWGTGACFFNPVRPGGTPVGRLSARARRRVLSSWAIPPQDFFLTDAGYVDPACYVDVRSVEQLFRTPARLNYFLRNSSKARLRLEGNAMPSFRDQSILTAIPDLCRSLFRRSGVEELSPEQRGELLRQLRFRFSADVAQLSRILGIPYGETARMLDVG